MTTSTREPTTFAWICADICCQGDAICSKNSKIVPCHRCTQFAMLSTVSGPAETPPLPRLALPCPRARTPPILKEEQTGLGINQTKMADGSTAIHSLRTQTYFRLLLVSAENNDCGPGPGNNFCDVVTFVSLWPIRFHDRMKLECSSQ